MIDYKMFEWPEITKETPLSEIKRIHWLIWDYAINRGEKPCTPYFNDCILCRYASFNRSCHHSLYEDHCRYCPAKWPDGTPCPYENSLYERWNRTRDPELAKQIRDIPFKEDAPETIKDMFEKYQSDGTYTPTEWDTGPDVGKEIVE